MRTQYYTASSIDGFIATTENSLDWLFQLGDVNETSYPAFIAEVGALAMGSLMLGSGQPLLPRQIAFPPLRLLSVRQLGTGFAELHYEVQPLAADRSAAHT